MKYNVCFYGRSSLFLADISLCHRAMLCETLCAEMAEAEILAPSRRRRFEMRITQLLDALFPSF